MENTLTDARKDKRVKADSPFKKEIKLVEEDHLLLPNSKLNAFTKSSNPLHALHSNAMQYHISKSSIFPSSFGSIDDQIPKSLVSIDDKYIQQCLDLINHSASLSSVKVSILPDYLNLSTARIGQTYDVDRKRRANMMKTPSFHQSASFKNTSNSTGAKGFIQYGLNKSPFGTSRFSSEYLESRASTRGNHKYDSDSTNDTIGSSSSSFYLSSPLSHSCFASLYRGMLQCRWKARTPHFMFSSNDLKEIYIAKLWKIKSEDDKGSNYVYLFQSGINSQNVDESGIDETRLAGKMTVSTCTSHCPNNSKIMETEFVLYGGIGTSEMEINTPNNNLRRKKKLSRKMVDVFRSHLSKQTSLSRFSGKISGEDYCLWEPYTRKDERFHLLENDLPSNFQLAAIVVKEHQPENHPDENAGGWGLKFLRKIEKKQSSHSSNNSVSSYCCGRNAGSCSTSTRVLIPAGLHGGPRTRNGGQSTLMERWRSDGGCDCGGWDLGCPLTTYKVKSTEEDIRPCVDTHGECKSLDIVVQGSDHGVPKLRMVNIRDDLYLIHFWPNLSSLQSFSIAVAIIHSRSPVLKPKTGES